jgi:NAD(P)-dependent dehydrogenase (short-subunit alcohol dehydrogenase family)
MNNLFSLKDKVIIVTGASSGIGRATAIMCSQLGAKVILLGRNEKRLKETLDSLENKGHIYFSLDINQDVDVDMFVDKLDKIDGIVHSAGIAQSQLFSFLKKEDLEDILNTNFIAPALFTKKIIKKKKINKNSSIVFISSISGPNVTFIGGASYSASKSAICGLAKTMALELAGKGIRVNTVLPGMIETDLINSIDSSSEDIKMDKKKYPLGEYGKPDDVAASVCFLLSSASKWMTGTDLKLDGGLTLR